MNKAECLAAMDDLLMAAWELRDTTKALALNKRWELVHKTPKNIVDHIVKKSDFICEKFTERLNNHEEIIYGGFSDDYDGIVNELTDLATANVMRYHRMYETLKEYEVVYTHRARFRKSFIRE